MGVTSEAPVQILKASNARDKIYFSEKLKGLLSLA